MATWLSVGCTSTPPKTTINPTLGRADLYDGHSTIAISQNQPPQNEQQALGQTKQAESLQKFDKAIELFRRAIVTSPSYFEQANKNLKRAMLSYREQVQLNTIKLGS